MRSLILAAALASTAIVVSPFVFLPTAVRAQTPEQIRVKVGATVTVPLPRKPKILGSEDPAIATATVLPSGQVKVTGKKAGKTRLIGRDFSETPMIIPVIVEAR